MAKKVVATLKTGTGKQFTKCIKMVKSEKTGSYMFKEGISIRLRHAMSPAWERSIFRISTTCSQRCRSTSSLSLIHISRRTSW